MPEISRFYGIVIKRRGSHSRLCALGGASGAVDVSRSSGSTLARHGSPSFPSGHAAKSLALALPLALIVPAGSVAMRLVKLALLLIASLVCYSRIVLGAHYLRDVLAGAAVALACVPTEMAAANLIYTRGNVTPEKLNTVVRKLTLVLSALALLLPFP